MGYPDYNQPFILHTNASLEGLGAVLYQKQNGQMRVLGYGSRSLSQAEKKYHSGKLEFLALKWAVCEHFCDHLYYAPHFTVYTGNPLTPGRSNGDAAALSRMPLDFTTYMKESTEDLTLGQVQASVDGIGAQCHGDTVWISALTHDEDLLETDSEFLAEDQPAIAKATILQAQKQDQTIGRELAFKLEVRRPSHEDCKRELPGRKALLRQWHKLKIGKDGLLRRESGPYKQSVLPGKFHRTIFKELHQEIGHLGAKRVVQL
ncbi:Hypothetical predicted protein [Paramuricea clavata]|uniref:Reverse transcriptase/retrotransposon-derived protein RNase H-like domain-containing protein n=1 Tax=Paramuricea clavata TaxID=317549 RepID=A0A6S7G929_PARCT|nr:Hypothetical predicted protein [Paramuricea clavata]